MLIFALFRFASFACRFACRFACLPDVRTLIFLRLVRPSQQAFRPLAESWQRDLAGKPDRRGSGTTNGATGVNTSSLSLSSSGTSGRDGGVPYKKQSVCDNKMSHSSSTFLFFRIPASSRSSSRSCCIFKMKEVENKKKKHGGNEKKARKMDEMGATPLLRSAKIVWLVSTFFVLFL